MINSVEWIVQKQLEAYNQRDLDSFVACYTEDIAIYNFSENIPFINGVEALQAVYREVFQNSPNLKASIKNRIIFDNKVIDEEEVTGRIGVAYTKVVVIYEVEEGRIYKVTFIRER